MLTPLDIENKKFAKQMVNGYSVDEVDEFLDELTRDYEKLYKENTEVRARVGDLEASLEKYKNIEATLQSTLMMAQSTAEEVKNVAQKEADQIVKETETKIISLVDDHEITRQALAQKEEIIESADKVAREITTGTREYADALLERLEEILKEALNVVHDNRKELK